jgi:hypothetical protein
MEQDHQRWDDLRKKHAVHLPLHDLCKHFPPIPAEQFQELVDDIKQNGLRDTIKLLCGSIFDGANRYFACLEAGVLPLFEEWRGSGDLVADIISLNLKRRHLNESQRALVAAKLRPRVQQQLAAESQGRGAKRANLRRTRKAATKKIAHTLNVSPRSVEDAAVVVEKGDPALVAKVEAGQMAVSAAASALRSSEREQTLSFETADVTKLLRQARMLVETRSIEYQTKFASYDSDVHDLVMADDPRFSWTEQDYRTELEKLNAYLIALRDTLRAVSGAASMLRRQIKGVENAIELLEHNQSFMLDVVLKRPPDEPCKS